MAGETGSSVPVPAVEVQRDVSAHAPIPDPNAGGDNAKETILRQKHVTLSFVQVRTVDVIELARGPYTNNIDQVPFNPLSATIKLQILVSCLHTLLQK